MDTLITIAFTVLNIATWAYVYYAFKSLGTEKAYQKGKSDGFKDGYRQAIKDFDENIMDQKMFTYESFNEYPLGIN